MSTELIIVLCAIALLIFGGLLHYLTIGKAVREAVKNAKPSITNNAPVHNYNYNGTENHQDLLTKETLTILIEGIVNTTKALKGSKDEKETEKTPQSEE